MQRLLAVLLVLIGLTGLVLGRLGETTWAPETETTATVDLSDAGPAVVIDPGVLYVGGEEGELVIEGASDVSVITAGNSDIEAYLEDVHHTRVTGASDWTTLGTQEVNPDGADELSEPTTSDLWRTVDTKPSPYTLDVHEFWAGENNDPNGEENEQPYRALLIVTDGTQPGAEKVSITWPVDAENEWVPFAYAGGAAIAVIGLVLLVVSLGGRRRDRDEDELVEDGPQDSSDTSVVPVAAGAVAGGAAAGTESSTAEGTDPSAAGQEPRGENVWSLGVSSTEDAPADTPADDTPADGASAEGVAAEDAPVDSTPADDSRTETGTPASDDRTEQIDVVDDEEGQR